VTATIEAAFLSQLEAHKGILHKVSRMYMDTAEDREDLRQEIIIQLWKSYNNFKQASEFSTWMYRVAINTAITYFKQEKKKKDRYILGDTPEQAATHYDGIKDEQMEEFYKAVHLLKPVEKALVFYFLEGQSHKQIGDSLGITEVNARVKLNRTKEKLQNIIKTKAYEL